MTVAFIILFIILFIFSVYIGFLIGESLSVHAITKSMYWRLNGMAVLVAVLLAFIFASMPLMYAVIVGLLAGTITGLKMGFGESTGPWKVLDRFFKANKDQRKVAEEGTGEARRQRRKDKEEGPDLIAVEGQLAAVESGSGDATEDSGGGSRKKKRKKK